MINYFIQTKLIGWGRYKITIRTVVLRYINTRYSAGSIWNPKQFGVSRASRNSTFLTKRRKTRYDVITIAQCILCKSYHVNIMQIVTIV